MRFDFHLLDDSVLKTHLKRIFEREKISCDEDSYSLIVKSAQGSVRDMLSIAEGIVSYTGGNITKDQVMDVLGTTDHDTNLEIVGSLYQKDVGRAISLLDGAKKSGKNMNIVAKDISQCVRDLIVAKTCQDAKDILGFTNDVFDKYISLAKDIDINALMKYMKIFSSVITELKFALSPTVLIETAMIDCILDDEKKN